MKVVEKAFYDGNAVKNDAKMSVKINYRHRYRLLPVMAVAIRDGNDGKNPL